MCHLLTPSPLILHCHQPTTHDHLVVSAAILPASLSGKQPVTMSTSDAESSALIHQRVRALCKALAVDGSSEADIERRISTTLPHLSLSSPPPQSASQQAVSALIDHTLLRADATVADIQTLCREANDNHFYSVCVNPYYVRAALHSLNELSAPSPPLVKVAAVCGFPLGCNTAAVKCAEARELRGLGAHEVDVVVNIAALQSGDATYVLHELTQVVQSCQPLTVKVILETALLSDSQIVDGCVLSALAGAAFVKTSTGFNAAGGASVRAVRLMRAVVGDRLGVKASGGIRDHAAARAVVEAGASRLGTSASVNIAAGEAAGDKTQQQQTVSASGAY